MNIYICVFTNSCLQDRCDKKSSYKQCLTGLNSVLLLVDWLPNQE